MISVLHLLWIIPLSCLLGGIIMTVLITDLTEDKENGAGMKSAKELSMSASDRSNNSK